MSDESRRWRILEGRRPRTSFFSTTVLQPGQRCQLPRHNVSSSALAAAAQGPSCPDLLTRLANDRRADLALGRRAREIDDRVLAPVRAPASRSPKSTELRGADESLRLSKDLADCSERVASRAYRFYGVEMFVGGVEKSE